MKVLVFTLSALDAGQNNCIPYANWPYKLAEIWTEVMKSDLSGRETQFAWRIIPNTMTLDLKKEIENFLKEMEPDTVFPQEPY